MGRPEIEVIRLAGFYGLGGIRNRVEDPVWKTPVDPSGYMKKPWTSVEINDNREICGESPLNLYRIEK